MNSSSNRAPGSSGKPRRRTTVLDLSTARRMLPLVRGIVADIQDKLQVIDRLTPVQENLDRHRRDLVWAERCNRYRVHDDLNAAERGIRDALAELNRLGVTLLDPVDGEVGFPTRVHDRSAFYTWRPGEDTVAHWSFEGEGFRRAIPAEWGGPGPDAKLVRYN
jgi:hypothetical protein